ncbi:ATP-binding cassette domain-containing protein [Streptomyces sp. NPDC001568]|uniref:ATP-binding cassette domain-containing protein n=1 Tax=Streptomyces sp. NPDC001568 TaxID=3364588 RepID=UPI0036AAC6C1
MDSPHGASVKAEDFGLKGPRGWAFRGVGIDAAPGSLIALEGPSGSGRTCLLLALTGRMKATEGHAEIGRHRLPKKMAAVRRICALGPVPGVNDLDQALTVTEQLREGALLQRHYTGPVRALLRPRGEGRAGAKARIEEALTAVALDLDTLPKGPRTSVRDLERLEAVRLSVAIALLGNPRLLALDDLDIKLSDAERVEVWALLRSIAARGTTVLAVCSEAPADVTVLRTVPAAAEPTPAPKATPAARATPRAKAAPAAKPAAEAAEPAGGGTAKPAPAASRGAGPKITWGLSEGAASAPDAAPARKPAPDNDTDDAPAGADTTPDSGAAAPAETPADTTPDTATDPETPTDTGAAAKSAPATTTHHDPKGAADDAIAEAGRA